MKRNTLNIFPPENESKTDAERTAVSDLKERIPEMLEVNITPEKKEIPLLAKKNIIATAYVRFPLIPIKNRKISTFTLTLFNYLLIYTLLVDNVYFERTGLIWHPLLSRMCFGPLAYIETLRYMDYAKLGNNETKSLINNILRDIPPERLPVPGPLVLMLKSICVSEPEDKTFTVVCPYLRLKPGPDLTGYILPAEDYMLGMPNFPVLAGFTNTIIDADGIDIPDYIENETFNDLEDRDLNGHIYPTDHWGSEERSSLLQLGYVQYSPYSREYSTQFNRRLYFIKQR